MKPKKIFKNIHINRIVKYFVFADLALFAGWGFVAPLLSVFIVEEIVGATLVTVGVSASIYWLARALVQPPVAILLDKRKGEKDDLYVLVLGLIGAGTSVIFLPFIESVFQLYIFQLANGISFGMYSVSWAAIFSRHLDRNRFAFDWSLDRATLGVSIAITSFLGGSIADKFGFKIPFIIAGVLAFVSAGIVFFAPELTKAPKKKGEHSAEVEASHRSGLPTIH